MLRSVPPLETALGIFRSAGFVFFLNGHVISPLAVDRIQTSSHRESSYNKAVAEV
jgi:hypothetical protein